MFNASGIYFYDWLFCSSIYPYYNKANLGLFFFSVLVVGGGRRGEGGRKMFLRFLFVKNTLPYDYRQEWPAWVVGVLGSGYAWAVRNDNWVAGKKGWVWRSRAPQICFWEQVGMTK